MIKVNLLQNKGQSAGDELENFELSDDLDASVAPQKELVLKVLIMCLCVGVLIFYESYNIDILNGKLRTLRNQGSVLNDEISKYGDVEAEVKKQQNKLNELEQKIEIVKKLAKSRIISLKALDFLQNIIPEKVWLTNLSLNDDLMVLEGSAINDEELEQLVSTMERKKNFFSNVILLKAVEVRTEDGKLKVFTVNANLVAE